MKQGRIGVLILFLIVGSVTGVAAVSGDSDTLDGQPVVTRSDWGERKNMTVDSVSGQPSVDKAQPLIISNGSDSTTGNGDFLVNWDKHNLDGKEDFVVTNQTGWVFPYEVEGFNTTSQEAVLWVYSNWTRDGTAQAQLVYGDVSSSNDNEDVTGTWDNTGQNAELVQHLQDDPLTGTDSSPNGNNGSVNGPKSISTGEFDAAGTFDGANDNIDIGSPTSLSIDTNSEPVTSVFWMKTTDTQNSRYPFSMYSDGGSYPWVFDLGSSGNSLMWKIYDGTNVDEVGMGDRNDGSWYHLAGSVDDANDQLEAWVGGTRQGTTTRSTTSSTLQSSSEVFIGERSGGGQDIDADMDELRIYSDSKDAGWMSADYDASPKAGQTFFSQSSAKTLGGVGGTTQSVAVDSISVSPDPLEWGESHDVSFNVSDDSKITEVTVEWFVDGEEVANRTESYSSSSVEDTFTDLYTVDQEGTHTIYVTATDDAEDSTTETIERDVSHPPIWKGLNDNATDEIRAGDVVNIGADFKATAGLETIYIETNQTGEFKNETLFGYQDSFAGNTGDGSTESKQYDVSGNSFEDVVRVTVAGAGGHAGTIERIDGGEPSGNTREGGAGGYADVEVNVSNADSIEIHLGNAGDGTTDNFADNAGSGATYDGGDGGANSGSNGFAVGGGGAGDSVIRVDDEVVMRVSGGGGGAAYYEECCTTEHPAGGGGGAAGGSGGAGEGGDTDGKDAGGTGSGGDGGDTVSGTAYSGTDGGQTLINDELVTVLDQNSGGGNSGVATASIEPATKPTDWKNISYDWSDESFSGLLGYRFWEGDKENRWNLTDTQEIKYYFYPPDIKAAEAIVDRQDARAQINLTLDSSYENAADWAGVGTADSFSNTSLLVNVTFPTVSNYNITSFKDLVGASWHVDFAVNDQDVQRHDFDPTLSTQRINQTVTLNNGAENATNYSYTFPDKGTFLSDATFTGELASESSTAHTAVWEDDYITNKSYIPHPKSTEITLGFNYTGVGQLYLNNTLDIKWPNIDTSDGVYRPMWCSQTNQSQVDVSGGMDENVSVEFNCSPGDSGTGTSTVVDKGDKDRVWFNISSVELHSNVTDESRIVRRVNKDDLLNWDERDAKSEQAWADGRKKNISITDTEGYVYIEVGQNHGNSSLHEGTHSMSLSYTYNTESPSGGGAGGGAGGGGSGSSNDEEDTTKFDVTFDVNDVYTASLGSTSTRSVRINNLLAQELTVEVEALREQFPGCQYISVQRTLNSNQFKDNGVYTLESRTQAFDSGSYSKRILFQVDLPPMHELENRGGNTTIECGFQVESSRGEAADLLLRVRPEQGVFDRINNAFQDFAGNDLIQYRSICTSLSTLDTDQKTCPENQSTTVPVPTAAALAAVAFLAVPVILGWAVVM